MENRQYLKMLLKGQQPQQRKSRTFFAFDGKIYLKEIKDIDSDKDFTLAIVENRADIAAWEDFKKSGNIEKSNKVTKEDLLAWEKYQIANDLPKDII